MLYKKAMQTECLVTHITIITTLTTMYGLMCYKTALAIECLITHTTNITALTTVCA
jgi:hypothetical protein